MYDVHTCISEVNHLPGITFPHPDTISPWNDDDHKDCNKCEALLSTYNLIHLEHIRQSDLYPKLCCRTHNIPIVIVAYYVRT